ncbi:MAG: DNA methyltransferase [Romboutsia sp.]
MLSWSEIESNAVNFSKTWKDCEGNERQEAQTFEKDLMSVFGVDWHDGLHEYQIRDMQGKIGYIDYLLPGKILIEMKSKGESLTRAYNQGYDYTKCLKPEEFPELLLVSDFDYIQVTNLKTMQTFKQFKVSQLKKHVRMLGILAGYNSEVTFKTDIEVNTDASYKMAKIHDRLKENGYVGQDLEIYLVRLLFCLFAEDTGIFEKSAFKNYIDKSAEDGSDLSMRMMALFSILDTNDDNRMANLSDELKKFRYINGNLFSKTLPLASFDSKMRKTLLECCDFNWSYISPAIFGAMFQGVMDEKSRREMGAHYTSEENILKLIRPLFLDELWDEFEKSKMTKAELHKFHEKISKLKFLDPACGCGNFLIITYRELRLLEFEVLKMIYNNKQTVLIDTICKIKIEQFYGIEYEEFPSQIAHVGMLLMKHQIDTLVSNYFGMNLIDFPIKDSANIVHGNALRIEWESIVTKDELSYIIGNPPFIGARWMSKEQKLDLLDIFENSKGAGNLDYVCAWYIKAAKMVQFTNIRVGYVSTNSIVQGEQVYALWHPLMDKYNIHIDYAYRTFVWSNEAKGKAKVHCIMVGFSHMYSGKKIIVTSNGDIIQAKNINAYLVDGENTFVMRRTKPLCDVPEMGSGNKPIDGGNYLFTEEGKNEFVKQEPKSQKWFRPWLGSAEFINGYQRHCLWLGECPPSELRKMPLSMKRVEAVRKFRASSSSAPTQKIADTPTRFHVENMPNGEYIVVPQVSSERRRYIPIGFLKSDVLCSDKLRLIPNASLYLFGILTSNVHMAWNRAVCGRLKSDYQYSKDIVYNNFPFPDVTEEQKEKISNLAQKILDIRSKYTTSSLADLYDPLTMPPDLLKAHQNLDKEVCKAYGTIWKYEEDCVADLMKLYKEKSS